MFQTCQNITAPGQVQMISDIINNAIGTMQMVDYPYSTNFLGALPANPVNSTVHWMFGNVSTISEPFD